MPDHKTDDDEKVKLILQELIKVTDELIKIRSKKKNVFSHAQAFNNKKAKHDNNSQRRPE